jgi:SAM-dependent methyltransferase
MPDPLIESVYPESRFLGFTRYDGTTHFLMRVQALLQPDDAVLDVGCGRGQRADDPCEFRKKMQNFRGENRKITGIDVDPAAGSNPYLDEFRQIEDVNHWPIADSSINLIYSDYVLEHVQNPRSFFSEAHRVLKQDGYLCLRTPNFFSYGALISWLIPNRLHAAILTRIRPECKENDVFPTVYRCNSRRKLRKTLELCGFEAVTYTIESEPVYLEFFPLAFRLAAIALPYLPSAFRSCLIAFARKRRIG